MAYCAWRHFVVYFTNVLFIVITIFKEAEPLGDKPKTPQSQEAVKQMVPHFIQVKPHFLAHSQVGKTRMKEHFPPAWVPVLGLEKICGKTYKARSCFWEIQCFQKFPPHVFHWLLPKRLWCEMSVGTGFFIQAFSEISVMNFQWGYRMQGAPNLFNNRTPFPQSICQVSWNILWDLNSTVGHSVMRAHGPVEKGNENTLLTFNQWQAAAGHFGKRRNLFCNHSTETASHFLWITQIPTPKDPAAMQARTPVSYINSMLLFFVVKCALSLNELSSVSRGPPPPL